MILKLQPHRASIKITTPKVPYVIKMTSQNLSIFKPSLSKILVALLKECMYFDEGPICSIIFLHQQTKTFKISLDYENEDKFHGRLTVFTARLTISMSSASTFRSKEFS